MTSYNDDQMVGRTTEEQNARGIVNDASLPPASQRRFSVGELIRWVAWTLLATLVGSWLVWYDVHLQRESFEEEIRAACHRAMPESADRCFDTVIIQRGGARR